MALPDINFASIRAHDGSRNAGFEELCCQLASMEPRADTSRFFRKGRGGDAGVECFTRATDGKETGWQAKYVMAWNKALASQLDASIETALVKHPKLTKYIVCLPFDLPDARAGSHKSPLQHWETWQEKWIQAARKQKRKLQIALWSKSDLTERLARDDPAYAGRLAYWFDQDILSGPWFTHQFEKARAALGSRYTPETNVELPIRRDFLGFTRDTSLNRALRDASIKVQEGAHTAATALKDAADKKRHRAIEQELKSVVAGFSSLPIGPNQQFPILALNQNAQSLLKSVRDALEWIYDQPPKPKGKLGVSRTEWAQHSLFTASDALNGLIDDLNSERWKLANSQALLLFGDAGTGKSHLLADVVEHHIASGFPGVLVLGSTFVDGEPWRQILGQLDLPATLQTKHFLGAMDAAAQASGVRAIICIDAINERNGMDVWPSRLAAFLKDVRPFRHVGVVVSCRSTYLQYIVPDSLTDEELHRIEHVGFSGRASEAARFYLDKRGIVRPGAPNLVPEFENPLFLKTCCDYLQKEGTRELPKGLTGVTQIFGFYVDAVTRALNQRMRLDPHLNVVPRAIRSLAMAIAARGTGYIDKSEAITLFDAIHASNNDLERSLLSQLESEGAIAIEAIQLSDGTRSDEVRFTFERFSDHQIATALLDRHLRLDDVTGSFATGTPLREVVVGEDAYRRSGIIEALSIQLPERANAELFDVFPENQNNWVLHDPFQNSLLWRDQRHFTDRTYEILKGITNVDQRTEILFSVTTEPQNKFNANFLHDRLAALSLPERDQIWTTFVNTSGDDETSSITTLISWSLSNGLEAIDDDRAELAGVALTWLLSASNRAVRDKSTKALACLLAKRLALAGRLIRRFASVNDLYVVERLMAACYGAVLQGTAANGLSDLAHAVHDTMFDGGDPPPNALLRDHASGILRYLNWRGELPKAIDLDKGLPPFHSAWPIEYVSDEQIETYKQDNGKGAFRDSIVGSAVNDGDFARYQIDHFAHHWTQAPIGSTNIPTYRDVALSWIDAFLNAASEQQVAAFNEVLDAAEILKGAFHGYQDTPDTLKLKECENKFRETLTADGWEEYRVKARGFVRHTLFDSDGRRTDTAALFDSGWARRWVCKRAHDYGWTPERFGQIERHRGGDYNRHEHRLERIGKKYQWLALYEFGARMADNLAMKSESWRGADKTRPYQGAWQVGLRKIDPSLLVTGTHYDGWGEWPRTWWVPMAPVLHEISRKERLAWRDSPNDIMNGASLIDLKDPKTGRRWLALDGFSHWNQRGIENGKSELQRGTWFRLNCVVTKLANRAKLLKCLRTERLTAPDDLPEIQLYGEHYLGEYPWHPALAELDDWEAPDEWRKIPVPVRAVVASYTQERGGYDYSIDKTVKVSLPAPWLMKAMGLRLSNGRNLTYVSTDGEVRFFDPSVSEPGPQAALVDREAFLALLSREKLCAFWVIAGEKDIYTSGHSGDGWGGRLAHTYVYELKGDTFACYKKIDLEKPSAEQLSAYLDGGMKVVSGSRNAKKLKTSRRKTATKRQAGKLARRRRKQSGV